MNPKTPDATARSHAFPELLTVPYRHRRPLPPFQEGDEIRFPESLVRALLEHFTRPGDAILDPFAGLGTTLLVAQDMDRRSYGVEPNAQRADWVEAQGFTGRLVRGDSTDIGAYDLPPMDFCLTSPPYMPRHHRWNPLYNGDPAFDGYDIYLARMQEIFRAVYALIKPGGRVVVQADNLTRETFSPLVWDLGLALSEVMALEGEMCVVWSECPDDVRPFTQCLVFRKAR